MLLFAVQSSFTEFDVSMVIRSLVAGFVCGLLPTAVAIWKRQTGSAVVGMGICVMCGFFGGLVLAGPVALILACLTAIGRSGAPRRPVELPPPDSTFEEEEEDFEAPSARPPAAESRPAPVGPTAGAPATWSADWLVTADAGVAVRCRQCSHLIPVGDDRPRPWCPKCGADLKTPGT
jgi:hypothetical protein